MSAKDEQFLNDFWEAIEWGQSSKAVLGEAFDNIRAEEREACAKVIDAHTPHPGTGWRERLAAKLRARGVQ